MFYESAFDSHTFGGDVRALFVIPDKRVKF